MTKESRGRHVDKVKHQGYRGPGSKSRYRDNYRSKQGQSCNDRQSKPAVRPGHQQAVWTALTTSNKVHDEETEKAGSQAGA